MALVVKDRVRETTTSTGTGTISLGGAGAGFQSFSVIGDDNTTYYTIADAATGDFEVGIGTYSAAGTTLSRDTVLESSSGGTAINFAAGVKDVFVTYPAERSVDSETPQTLTNKTLTNPVINGFTGDTNVVNIGSGQVYKDAAGNLGVGTSLPGAKVHINTGASGQLAIIQGSGLPSGFASGVVGGANTLEITTEDEASLQATRLLLRGGTNGADIEFYRGARTAEAQSMIIKGDTGNVGIATPTPSTALEVIGTIKASAFEGVFPSGTLMLFAQTAAPTGWTKSTAHDNKALRVVSGTAGSGGSVAFTTAFVSQTPTGTVATSTTTANATATNQNATATNIAVTATNNAETATNNAATQGGTVNNHTLSTAQVPNATGGMALHGGEAGAVMFSPSGAITQQGSIGQFRTSNGPFGGSFSVRFGFGINLGFGGGAHNHSFSGSSHNHTQNSHNHTQNSHNHTQNAHTHTQNAHNHTATSTSTFTGTAINLAVQYVDVIIAAKD